MQRLILFIALIGPILMYGQQESEGKVYTFTLQQAQEFALENNLEKKNAELDVKAAKKKVWETTAIGLPQVNGTLDYAYNKFAGDQENPLDSLFNPIFEFMGYLHSPQEVQAAFQQFQQNADPGSSEDVSFVPDQSLSATISVNQIIFSGEYIVGLQAAKTYLQLSKNSNEKKELDIKESINTNYYAVLSLEKNLGILKENRDNLKKNLDEAQATLKQGLMEQTAVDQIEYNYYLLQNSYNKLSRQLKISYDFFKIALGMNINDSLILTENLETFVDNAKNIALQDSIIFSLENNIDYRMLETQVDINKLSLKREKSTYLPNINGYYRYNKDILDVPVDFTPDHTLGASASIPIFSSGMRNAKVQQAKIELIKAENLKEMQSKNIQILALQAQYNLKSAYENYINEEKNFKLAEKIYNNTKIKFNEGMAGSFDLTQSNTQFLSAISSYTTSIIDLLNAKTQLNKINNTL